MSNEKRSFDTASKALCDWLITEHTSKSSDGSGRKAQQNAGILASLMTILSENQGVSQDKKAVVDANPADTNTQGQVMALACLLACLQYEGDNKQNEPLAWLGVINKKNPTYGTMSKNASMLIKELSEKPTKVEDATVSTALNVTDRIPTPTAALNAYQGLKDKIEEKALGAVASWAKFLLVWFILIFYALGLAAAVFGALCEKFLSGVMGCLRPMDTVTAPKDFAMALMLPGFGVLTLANFWTNVKIVKVDVEDFVNGILYWCKGHGNGKPRLLVKASAFLVSICSASILSLMTWYYMEAGLASFSLSMPALSIAFACAGFITEGMLLYGVIMNYWAPILTSPIQEYKNFKKKYFSRLPQARQYAFSTVCLLLVAVVAFGLAAALSAGLGPFGTVAWLSFMPTGASWVLLGLATVVQLPIYLRPCLALAKYLTHPSKESEAQATTASKSIFKEKCTRWWGKFVAGVKQVTQSLWQGKKKFMGCWLLGITSCFLAVGFTVGWAAIVTSPQIVVPLCVAAGLLYGLWKFSVLCKKDLPNHARIVSNGAANGALADPELGAPMPVLYLAAGAASWAAGAYGEKDAIDANDSIRSKAEMIATALQHQVSVTV